MGREVDVRAGVYGDGASTFLIGKDGRIAKVWRKVSVPKHAAEVMKAVAALG